MKSRQRLFVRGLAVGAFFLALFSAYWHVGLFPGNLHAIAVEKLGEWTGKKIFFQKAVYIPFHGLSLHGVTISERDGKPVFSAESVTVDVRPIDFFRNKEIRIRRCILDAPRYDYSLERDHPRPRPMTAISGQIPVPVVPEDPRPDLLKIKHGPDVFLPENVYIEQIQITRGLVTIRPRPSAPVTEVIHSMDVRLTLDAPNLRFDGRVELGVPPYASIDLNGAWNLELDRFQFRLKTHSRRVPSWLTAYQKNHFLVLESGELFFNTTLLSGKPSELLFKTEAHLKNATLRHEPTRYMGQMRLFAEGSFDTRAKKFRGYQGRLELTRVKATRLSKAIPEIDNLVGEILFQPDLLRIHSIRGEYKKLPFEASGTVESFKERILKGRVRSNLSISQALGLLPKEYREKLHGFQIQGEGEALTLLSGSLKKGSRVLAAHKIVVRDGRVTHREKKINWEGLEGEFSVNDKGLRLSNARFRVGGKSASLEAFLPKQAGEAGFLRFQNDALSLLTDYRVFGQDLNLENGRVSMPGAEWRFHGKCLRWTDPYLDLQGDGDLDLGRLAAQPWAGFLRQWPLSGHLHGPFILRGAWGDPLAWDFRMDAEGAAIQVKRFLLEKFQIQVRMKNRLINIPYVHAAGYGGTLGCRLLVDLTKKEPFFDGRVNVIDFDLSRMRHLFDPPKEDLSGALVGQIALRGNPKDPSSYRGQGAVSIIRGYLWKTDKFKDMGRLPLVRVEGLDWVTFGELSARLDVKDGRIYTEDLNLLGDTVDLTLKGYMDFQTRLDFVMDIQYSKDIYRGADETGGLAKMMVNNAGQFISKYHIHGTLKEPKQDKIALSGTGKFLGRKVNGLMRAVA